MDSGHKGIVVGSAGTDSGLVRREGRNSSLPRGTGYGQEAAAAPTNRRFLFAASDLRAALGLTCTLLTIHYTSADMVLTITRKTLQANEQNRPDVARAQTRWQRRYASLDMHKPVFPDESGATHLRGRSVHRAKERSETAIAQRVRPDWSRARTAHAG